MLLLYCKSYPIYGDQLGCSMRPIYCLNYHGTVFHVISSWRPREDVTRMLEGKLLPWNLNLHERNSVRQIPVRLGPSVIFRSRGAAPPSARYEISSAVAPYRTASIVKAWRRASERGGTAGGRQQHPWWWKRSEFAARWSTARGYFSLTLRARPAVTQRSSSDRTRDQLLLCMLRMYRQGWELPVLRFFRQIGLV